MKSGPLFNGLVRHSLSNGLTVLLLEDRDTPIVSSAIWYGVGSRHESCGRHGISHFLEHMMFKGTERLAKGEIDDLTARHGGHNNAFTSNDYTAYYFSFASDRWQTCLEIEADRMTRNRFDRAEFELEKQVVLEELRMDLDSPWGALRRQVEMHAFEHHPYRYPVIGLEEDLRNLELEQMVEHYRGYYNPNNAVLVVVGDFDSESTLERIERLFGPIPSHPLPPGPAAAEENRCRQVRLELDKASHVGRLLIALPAPSVQAPEHDALRVADKILSEGKLGLLYRRLVDQEGLVSSIETGFSETRDPYLFSIQAELLAGCDPARVEAIIFEELDRLASLRLPEAALERAKMQSRTHLLAEMETGLERALALGLMETLGRPSYWHDYPERILDLEAQDLGRLARHYWSPERATVGVLAEAP